MLFRQRYEDDLRLIGSLQAWLVLSFTALALLALPLLLPGYVIYNVTLFLIYSLVALSLTLLVGFTGQVSLGHAGFLAAGAYTTAFLVQQGLPFLLALLCAVVVAALLGLVIGVPSLRLEGPYLAIATLGFGIAIQQILNNWALVGASAGMLAARPAFVGFSDRNYYWLVLVFVALITWMCFNLQRSHIGRAFKAVRDAELAAQMSGINLAYYKTLAFVLSAAITGLAGGFYGALIGYITPGSFDLLLSIKFLLMIIIGGLGFLPGAIIGAAFIVGLDGYLSRAQQWSQLIFGLVVVVLMMLEPLGLYGRWLKIERYWKSWPM